MTTIPEKAADHATLIDDITTEAGNLVDWTTGIDASINNNGGDSSDWRNFAGLIKHDPTGIYVLMYVVNGSWANDPSGNNWQINPYDDYQRNGRGVKFVFSNDWNSTDSIPAGSTTVMGSGVDAGVGDYMRHETTGNHADDSFVRFSPWYGSNNRIAVGNGLLSEQNGSGTLDDALVAPCSYFGSIRNDGFTFAIWNTSSDANGLCNWISFEQISKFWNDGKDDFVVFQRGNRENDHNNNNTNLSVQYGFQAWYINGELDHPDAQEFGDLGPFDGGDWGHVNPNTNDDTFFFRRPVVYTNAQREDPVGYVEDVLVNRQNQGGAHGDVITHDATDYRVIDKKGGAGGDSITAALRFE